MKLGGCPATVSGTDKGVHTCMSDLQLIFPIVANSFIGSHNAEDILATVSGTAIAVHKPSCNAISFLKINRKHFSCTLNKDI